MRTLCSSMVLLSLLMLPGRAFAGGLFYAGSGTRALGRAAAFHVRADDPMALLYNPAALADLEGMQVLVNANLAVLDACIDPAGTADDTDGPTDPTITGVDNGSGVSQLDGWRRDVGTYAEQYEAPGDGVDVTRFGVVPRGLPADLRKTWLGTTLPRVCNDSALLPIPNAVFTYQLAAPGAKRELFRGLTIAVGFVAPGAVAKTTWGNADATVRAKGHATAEQLAAAVPSSGSGTLGRRLPAGIRPDVVCDPSRDDCSAYCDPETDASCAGQYFCDPTQYDCDLLPTPTRHMMVQQDPIAAPLTVGFGYRPLAWLAVGGAFTYQALRFNSVVHGIQGTNIQPELEMRIENELIDWFVPSVSGSLLLTPLTGLELAAHFIWRGEMAGDTKVTITDGAFAVGGEGGRLPVTTVIERGEGIETVVPQPWEVGVGIRFALPRGGGFSLGGPSTRTDPMASEWFDVEVDFVYEHNSSVDAFSLKSDGNAFAVFQGYDPSDDPNNPQIDPLDPSCFGCTSELSFLSEMKLKREWRDQYVVRVGTDVNVIPAVLALRAGYNFETRGVTPAFQAIDSFPSQRQGIHGGLTFRIGAWDLSAAYAHMFQEQIRVLPYGLVETSCNGRDECIPRADSAQLAAGSPNEGTVAVNAGVYDVSWDVFSLGLTKRW